MRLTLKLWACTASICIGLGPGHLAQAAEYNWPAYGGAPGGGHYTTSTQITPANVAQLSLAWHHRSGDFIAGTQDLSETGDSMEGRPSSFIVTPIMFNDTVYYCTPFNRVFALDPATGKEKWVFDAQVDMTNELLTNCRGVSSWADHTDNSGSPCSKRILLGTLDARLIALDADTGARCTDFGQNGEVSLTQGLSRHEADEYSITSAPAIIGDTLITGSYVADSVRLDIPSGVVRAYDVR
ncbi:MAG: pyrroloquinoline quinone-dependent dehydrogenase, partial [Pseudomonadota bacterium]